MSAPTTPLRVLFCIGINQNFFDLPRDGVTAGDVWSAFVEMMDGIKALPGVDFIGDIDDDSHLVGPSDSWPWTCYLLADVDTQETVQGAEQYAGYVHPTAAADVTSDAASGGGYTQETVEGAGQYAGYQHAAAPTPEQVSDAATASIRPAASSRTCGSRASTPQSYPAPGGLVGARPQPP